MRKFWRWREDEKWGKQKTITTRSTTKVRKNRAWIKGGAMGRRDRQSWLTHGGRHIHLPMVAGTCTRSTAVGRTCWADSVRGAAAPAAV